MNAPMLTRIDASLLAAAFPPTVGETAMAASTEAAGLLHATQWTDRFSLVVGSEQVLIPYRLHFAAQGSGRRDDAVGRLVRALQTRSNDGFARQRAVRDLLVDTMAWEAPFIVALIGEYIVEILDDIADRLTPELEQCLATFIAENPGYWLTTKRRVASYWNAYYRWTRASELRQPYTRTDYVGFRLIERLEAVVPAGGQTVRG